jgi:hypothetical protein
MRLAVRILLPLALTGSPALAQIPALGFQDIRLIDPAEIEILDPVRVPPFVRAPEARLLPTEAPPSPDPSLARPVSQLALDKSALLEVPAPRGTSLPGTAALVEFTLAGNTVRMFVIEGRPDADFDALHMTLLAIDSEDYARLTVSRSGPEVIGTVVIDDDWYRILPDDFDPEYQLVYPLGVRESSVWERETPPDLETRAGQLEARHLQMGWVAETRPDSFETFVDGRPESYRGPSLGVLSFWDSLSFDAAGNGSVDADLLRQEVERFLTEMQRFTWVYDRIEVELEPRFETDQIELLQNGFSLQLTQLINDIPLSRPLRLKMLPTGDVVEYAGVLMPHERGGIYGGARIPQEEARAASELALQAAHGLESTGEFLEELLFYNVVAETELEPIWRMTLRARCGIVFNVDIDAISGEPRDVNLKATPELEALQAQFPRFRRPSREEIYGRCRFGR